MEIYNTYLRKSDLSDQRLYFTRTASKFRAVGINFAPSTVGQISINLTYFFNDVKLALVFREIAHGFLNLLFPLICIHCKKPLSPDDYLFQLCAQCRETIEPNLPPFCRKCSRPLAGLDRTHCRTCDENTHHFDRAWATIIYNDTSQDLIHVFKYANKTSLRHYFGHCLNTFWDTYQNVLPRPDLLVPVPLHPTRQRERGYNQAQLLAEKLAQHAQIPLDTKSLVRSRFTPNQAAQSRKERWTNISGAFKIKHQISIREKNILLIDDLYTTGATASEAAAVLKAAGAVEVNVLTLAIARPGKGIR
jgi:ComF family protein